MGKWATYAKRGAAALQGFLQAPQAGDYTIGAPTTTTIPFTRIAPVPAGATTMNQRVIQNSTNLVVFNGTGGASGLTTGTLYRVQAAWFNGLVQVSDWSATTNVTTL